MRTANSFASAIAASGFFPRVMAGETHGPVLLFLFAGCSSLSVDHTALNVLWLVAGLPWGMK
jgi:hypothetical protein